MGQPRIVPTSPPEKLPQDKPDFSLVLGGPLYQLFLRSKLARPPLDLLRRRVLTLSLICWLPLLLLAAVAGHLMSGVADPFLRDPEVHIRFLLAVPLLILAEVYVHERMRAIVQQFLSRGIVVAQDQARFEEIVASAMRLRNSVVAELILVLVVVTVGPWFWRQNVTLTVSSWYAEDHGAGLRLNAAGWYYAAVSLSIFRFLLCRWYYRLFIWYRFLWQVRGMPLHLNLYHPDRAGGLGFLSSSVLAFAPVAVAQTMLMAGVIYSHILHQGERLPSFKMELAGIVIFCVVVLVLPLGFFARKLERAGRTARLEFGILASHYVNDFRRKWTEGNVRAGEPLLGTPDIQSLADLDNSFRVVSGIGLFPITKEALIRLIIMVILPLLPLMLTMFPLDEVLKQLLKLAF